MAKTNIIAATSAFINICNIVGPIKLVSTNRNVIKVYIAKISNGCIKPVIAATANLTLDVAQKTNVIHILKHNQIALNLGKYPH